MRVATAGVVSESRVQECETSARFWAEKLGPYTDRMNKRADYFAIGSAILTSITALGAWSTLATSTHWLAVLAVALVSTLSAAVAVIPRIRGYTECAKASASLSSRYGSVRGELVDALEMVRTNHPDASACARAAIEKFEAIRKEKGELKPYPRKLQKQRDAAQAAGDADHCPTV